MTTNAFDESRGLMATDSRWSIQHGKYVIYLDDTGFEKIEISNGHAFMFAGNGARIQEWKDWMRSDPAGDSNQPSESGICLCVVDMSTQKVKSSFKQTVVPGGGYFAGTGSLFAVPCWLKNNCAKRSVETAKESDIYSGGEVKFYDFVSGDNNLNYPSGNITIKMVSDAISRRGLVMTSNVIANQPMSFAEAANDNQDLAEIRAKIASGELSANAPSEGMYAEWTAEEKSRLKSTLADVFGWKK